MTSRECIRQAVNILMRSPLYFRMDLSSRQQLVKEFCLDYFAVLIRR